MFQQTTTKAPKYTGHSNRYPGLQAHSVGEAYPAVLVAQDTADGLRWHVLLGGHKTVLMRREQAQLVALSLGRYARATSTQDAVQLLQWSTYYAGRQGSTYTGVTRGVQTPQEVAQGVAQKAQKPRQVHVVALTDTQAASTPGLTLEQAQGITQMLQGLMTRQERVIRLTSLKVLAFMNS